MCGSRLYRHMAGMVLELVGWIQSSQMIGTFVQGVVFEPLRAEMYVIPVNSAQVELILNEPRRIVTVTVQFPAEVDLPHVPQGK
jgi:hypothetical protein